MVRVYYARSTSIIGACGCHPWVALKERGGTSWESHQVIGWRLWMGMESCVDRRVGPPDRLWFGQTPVLAGELVGAAADAAIPRVRAAAASYAHGAKYRLCPGPNSNTFVAHLIRHGGLRVALPPHAVGKDYVIDSPCGPYGCCQRAASGTGVQASLCGCGCIGATCAVAEGLRCQLCLLEFGLSPWRLHIYWPGLGTIRLGACCGGGGGRCIDPIAPWPLTAEEAAEAASGRSGGWNLEEATYA